MTSRKSTSSNTASLSVDYEDTGRARRVERALEPEVGDIDGDRSTVALARDGTRLDLRVEARDLTALRASLGTWLSLVSVAEAVDDAA